MSNTVEHKGLDGLDLPKHVEALFANLTTTDFAPGELRTRTAHENPTGLGASAVRIVEKGYGSIEVRGCVAICQKGLFTSGLKKLARSCVNAIEEITRRGHSITISFGKPKEDKPAGKTFEIHFWSSITGESSTGTVCVVNDSGDIVCTGTWEASGESVSRLGQFDSRHKFDDAVIA